MIAQPRIVSPALNFLRWLVVTSLAASAIHAQIVVGTWTNTTDSSASWAASANWSDGIVPGATSGDTAHVTATLADNQTIDLGDTRVLGTLNIGSAATPLFGYTLSGGRLVFDDPSGTATLNHADNAGSVTFASAVTLTSSLSATIGANATTTFSGSVSGHGDLEKWGDGTLVFTGTNDNVTHFSLHGGTLRLAGDNTAAAGSFTVSSGTLEIGSDTAFGDHTLFFSGDGAIAASGGARTVSVPIEFGTSLRVAGAQDLTFDGEINGDAASSTLTISNSGVTVLAGFLSRSGSSFSALTFDVAADTSVFLEGEAVYDELIKTGAGTLTLSSNVNSDSEGLGNITVTAGTLQTGDGGDHIADAANVIVNHGATLALGSAETIALLDDGGDGGGTVNLGGHTLTLGGSGDSVFSGTLTGSGGLTVAGHGANVYLGGASDFSGGTTISTGRVILGNPAALGTGPITLDGGWLQAGDGNHFSATGTFTLANDWHVTNDSVLGGEQPMLLTGAGTLHGWVALAIPSGSTVTIQGVIGETESSVLFKDGDGTLVLSGANTHTGGTSVEEGTLRLANVAALGSGTLTLSGGVLDLGGFSPTLGTVAFARGSFTNGSLDHAAAFEAYAGSVSGNLGGSAALLKDGVDPVTLSGNNTYTGGTTINDGTLILGHVSALGAATNTLTLNDGILDLGGFSPATGAVIFNGGNFINGTLGNSASFEVQSGNISGNLGGSAPLTKTGTDTVTLSGTNSYTGGTTIQAGTLTLANASALGSTTGTLTLSGGTLNLGTFSPAIGRVIFDGGAFTNGSLNNSAAFEVRSGSFATVLGGAGALFKTTAGTVTLSTAQNYTGGTFVDEGVLALGASDRLANSGALTVRGGTLALGAFSETVGAVSLTSGSITGSGSSTLTGSSYAVESGSISAILGGAGGLTKSSAGTVVLSANNTYSGTTTVNAGTLQLGDGGVTGSVAGGLSVASGATLALNHSDSFTFSTALADGATLSQRGGGTLTVGVNPSAIKLDVTNGTLAFNAASVTTSGLSGTGGTIQLPTSSLTVNSSTDATVASVLIGASPLNKTGSGTLALTGNNSGYTGTTTVTGGLVEFTTAANLGTGRITLNGGGLRWASGSTVDVSSRLNNFGSSGVTLDTNGNNVTFASIVFGTALTKAGSGTLTVPGFAPAASITIAAGTLDLGIKSGGGILGADSVAVAPGATLTFGSLVSLNTLADVGGAGGTVAIGAQTLVLGSSGGSMAFSGNFTGTGAIQKSGAGTLTLSSPAASAFSGRFQLDGGTLALGASHQFSNLSQLTIGAATFDLGAFSETTNQISLNSGNITGTGTLTGTSFVLFSGNVSAPLAGGILYKIGSDTITLAHANSYAGGTDLLSGTLALGDDSALGTGALQLDGGTLSASDGPRTIANNYTLTADSTIAGAQPITFTGAGTLTGLFSLTVDAGSSVTLHGAIGQSRASVFTKLGAGTLVVQGANTYTGGTTLSAGVTTLGNASGSAFGSGPVTVASGATLKGNGSFSGPLTLSGTIAPGNSPGLQTTGAQTWTSGGAYLWELNRVAGTRGSDPGWDWLNINGSLTIDATSGAPFALNLSSLTPGNTAGDVIDFNSSVNTSYTIASATDGIFGFDPAKFSLNPAGFTNALNGGSFSLSLGNDNKDLNLNFIAGSPIPEPSTYAAIFGALALGVAAVRRRRGRSL